jgi:hypothetical protein
MRSSVGFSHYKAEADFSSGPEILPWRSQNQNTAITAKYTKYAKTEDKDFSRIWRISRFMKLRDEVNPAKRSRDWNSLSQTG